VFVVPIAMTAVGLVLASDAQWPQIQPLVSQIQIDSGDSL
jgi:hypothetical protein